MANKSEFEHLRHAQPPTLSEFKTRVDELLSNPTEPNPQLDNLRRSLATASGKYEHVYLHLKATLQTIQKVISAGEPIDSLLGRGTPGYLLKYVGNMANVIFFLAPSLLNVSPIDVFQPSHLTQIQRVFLTAFFENDYAFSRYTPQEDAEKFGDRLEEAKNFVFPSNPGSDYSDNLMLALFESIVRSPNPTFLQLQQTYLAALAQAEERTPLAGVSITRVGSRHIITPTDMLEVAQGTPKGRHAFVIAVISCFLGKIPQHEPQT